MAEEAMEDIVESQVANETPVEDVFQPPSIQREDVVHGVTYSHFSDLPETLRDDMTTECVLGVDEAGRGPVLGPMVYGVFYLPLAVERSLLAETHHFDDSKVLTPETRSSLMQTLCKPGSDLYTQCGWATRLLSARSISAGMLQNIGAYNLNAQAMDATIELIRGVLDRGVNVTEVYIDTIGNPATYQKKLEKIFPSQRITVAKKADSLYPCVSAASVCAKVTRDASLEVCAEHVASLQDGAEVKWGSGYPSDARCTSWLKGNMDPVFGWGPECRFSWGTAKELLEVKNKSPRVDWPDDDDGNDMKMTDFLISRSDEPSDELANWYGRRFGETVF